MKNIKTFESYSVIDIPDEHPIKKYGESFPLMYLSPGDRITYLGVPFTIESVDEYSMTIKSESDGSKVNINQNMFNQKGFIKKENVPYKLR